MKIVFLALLLGIVSCASLSKNQVKLGEFIFSGGVVKNSRINDDLVMKRISWFQELTLLFDMIYIRLDKDSIYYEWLSAGDKEILAGCADHFIVMDYSLDSKKLSEAMMVQEFEKFGYSRITISSFKSHLYLHPDFERLSLKSYRIIGVCRKSREGFSDKVQIGFPEYEKVTVE